MADIQTVLGLAKLVTFGKQSADPRTTVYTSSQNCNPTDLCGCVKMGGVLKAIALAGL